VTLELCGVSRSDG